MTPPPLTIEVIRNRKQTVEDESAKVSDREEKKRSEMKHSTAEDKGRAFPVDQNLPRWLCQNCHHSLCFVGADSYVEKYLPDSSSRSGMHVSSIHGASSVLDSTRMDNSFVVLPKQSPQRQGLPLHPQGGGPTQTDSSSLGKVMDESFVVVYKNESASDGGASQSPVSDGAHGAPIAPNNSGFNATVTVLKRAFEIATTQTQVEQSLCLECMRVLSDKLDKEVEDVNRDIEAYEACLQRMEGESRDVLSEADFLKEKLKVNHPLDVRHKTCMSFGSSMIEEEGRKLEAAIEETEKQYAEVTAELKELETKSNRFKELEGRYWHEFNNFQFQLISHQVEWDEINAAWGQACLLLHTMCQYFQPKFPYRIKILPMGSYPRIMDLSNNTYELFGPVNLFWSTRYDKAMTLYLTCLKDFADFSYLKDQENSIPPEKCFKLPYKIENDKVKSYSITVSFNKQENWTKALKYTLWNLKWALYWFIGNTNFQPLSATVSQRTDPSAVGTLYPKRGTDLKFGSLNS
ncbi:beclin-1-like protein isoform X3 [Punica granatum]|uniref:Beclin-1-like protein isoform X3 n=1 Tax=Punica granatum TaxID=22663 RepID=A0A6P8BYZ2_PUNGR|nr:beclin-1-like protein isoform X3 [Punica granatum]